MCKCTPMQVKKKQVQSHAKMCTHKSSQTPPYTQERSKAQYTEPKDTVIAKGTDTQSLALKQATEWHMGVKRAQAHSHARTTQTASTRAENITKKVQGKGTKKGMGTQN